VEIVGVISPLRDPAHAAWRRRRKQTVDIKTPTCAIFFVVIIHRLLEPQVKTRSLPVGKNYFACVFAASWGPARCGFFLLSLPEFVFAASGSGLPTNSVPASMPRPNVLKSFERAAADDPLAFWQRSAFP